MENRISIVIPEEDIQKVKSSLAEIQQIMAPYFASIAKGRAKRMVQMADGTLPFVEKSAEYAVSNPQFNPPFLEVEELKKDLAAFKQLKPFLTALEQLFDEFKDTVALAGSEAYDQARIYYNSVKYAAKMGVNGSEAIYDDLSKRYQSQGQRDNKPTAA